MRYWILLLLGYATVVAGQATVLTSGITAIATATSSTDVHFTLDIGQDTSLPHKVVGDVLKTGASCTLYIYAKIDCGDCPNDFPTSTSESLFYKTAYSTSDAKIRFDSSTGHETPSCGCPGTGTWLITAKTSAASCDFSIQLNISYAVPLTVGASYIGSRIDGGGVADLFYFDAPGGAILNYHFSVTSPAYCSTALKINVDCGGCEIKYPYSSSSSYVLSESGTLPYSEDALVTDRYPSDCGCDEDPSTERWYVVLGSTTTSACDDYNLTITPIDPCGGQGTMTSESVPACDCNPGFGSELASDIQCTIPITSVVPGTVYPLSIKKPETYGEPHTALLSYGPVLKTDSDYQFLRFTRSPDANFASLNLAITYSCGGCEAPYPYVDNYDDMSITFAFSTPELEEIDISLYSSDLVDYIDLCGCNETDTITWYYGISYTSTTISYDDYANLTFEIKNDNACPVGTSGGECSGRGTCNTITGQCECDAGYIGMDCGTNEVPGTPTFSGVVRASEEDRYVFGPVNMTNAYNLEVTFETNLNSETCKSMVMAINRDCGGCDDPWPQSSSLTYLERISVSGTRTPPDSPVQTLVGLHDDTRARCGCEGNFANQTWYITVETASTSSDCRYSVFINPIDKCVGNGPYVFASDLETSTCLCDTPYVSDPELDYMCTKNVTTVAPGAAATLSIPPGESQFIEVTGLPVPVSLTTLSVIPSASSSCSTIRVTGTSTCGDCPYPYPNATSFATSDNAYSSQTDVAVISKEFKDFFDRCGCVAGDAETYYYRLSRTSTAPDCTVTVSVSVAPVCPTNDTSAVCSGGGSCGSDGFCACDSDYMGLECSLYTPGKWWVQDGATDNNGLLGLASSARSVLGDDDIDQSAGVTAEEVYNKIDRLISSPIDTEVVSYLYLSSTNDEVIITASTSQEGVQASGPLILAARWEEMPVVVYSSAIDSTTISVTTSQNESTYDYWIVGDNSTVSFTLEDPVEAGSMFLYIVFLREAYEEWDATSSTSTSYSMPPPVDITLSITIDDATGTSLGTIILVMLLCLFISFCVCTKLCGGRIKDAVAKAKEKAATAEAEQENKPEEKDEEKEGGLPKGVRVRKNIRRRRSEARKYRGGQEGGATTDDEGTDPQEFGDIGSNANPYVDNDGGNDGGNTGTNVTGISSLSDGSDLPSSASDTASELQESSSDPYTNDYSYTEMNEVPDAFGIGFDRGGTGSCDLFSLLAFVLLRVVRIIFDIIKIFINVCLLNASFGFYLDIPIVADFEADLPEGLHFLLILSELFSKLNSFTEGLLDWNCGGVLSIGTTFLTILLIATVIIILVKDLLLRVAIQLAKYKQNFAVFRTTVGGMVFDAMVGLFVAFLFFVLQIVVVAFAAVASSGSSGNRTCSDFDYQINTYTGLISIVILLIAALIMFFIFAGTPTRTFAFASYCAIPLIFLDAIHRLIFMTFGVWTNTTVKAYGILERAEKYDDDDDDDDNQHERVISIMGRSRGLVWIVVPFLIVLTKIAETVNSPPVFVFTRSTSTEEHGVLRLRTPRWIRIIQWFFNLLTLTLVVLTAIFVKITLLSLAIFSLFPLAAIEVAIQAFCMSTGRNLIF